MMRDEKKLIEICSSHWGDCGAISKQKE